MDSVKLILESLSPVHIGSQERGLDSGDFIKDGKFCYVVDDAKLSESLRQWGLSQKFSTEVMNSRGNFSLYSFLKNCKKASESDLIQIAAYRMESSSAQGRIRYPKPFIRDGQFRPFIPGTSVKGAIRTAILYSIVNRDEVKLNEFRSYVKKKLDEIERRSQDKRMDSWTKENQKKWFSQIFMDDILIRFNLPPSRIQYGPNTDILRCLKISDSLNYPDRLRLEDVMLMSLRSGRVPYNKNDTILNVECIPPGVNLEFTLSIDKDILKLFQKQNKLPFNNLDDIIGMIKEFCKEQWDEEWDFFDWLKDSKDVSLQQIRSFYDPDYNSAIRIGWGSGLLGTTLDLLLTSESRERLRNLLFINRDDEAPKSRRMTVSRVEDRLEAQMPLGWMLLRM